MTRTQSLNLKRNSDGWCYVVPRRKTEQVTTNSSSIGLMCVYRTLTVYSSNPTAHAPFAGMAELYFPSREDALAFQHSIQPDGKERWVDGVNMQIMNGDTEMIGVQEHS